MTSLFFSSPLFLFQPLSFLFKRFQIKTRHSPQHRLWELQEAAELRVTQQLSMEDGAALETVSNESPRSNENDKKGRTRRLEPRLLSVMLLCTCHGRTPRINNEASASAPCRFIAGDENRFKAVLAGPAAAA